MNLTTTFLTFHRSGSDLHVRTDDGILFLDKSKTELHDVAQRLARGSRVEATGSWVHSKTLSTMVFACDALAVAASVIRHPSY